MGEAVSPERAALASGEARTLALEHVPLALVLTDPTLPDNPIVYVNRAFEDTTGYARSAAVGRNCRFLQGADTSPAAVRTLRDGIERREEVTVDLLNYRADGAPFWNRLHVVPLGGGEGESPRFFMGVQRVLGNRREDVVAGGAEDVPLSEVTHRVKNHLAMVVGMIRTQARAASADPQRDFAELARRVESLQLLYQEMSDSAVGTMRQDRVALGAYVSRVASAVATLGSGGNIRTAVEVDAVECSPETAAQVGLVLSEVLTNALQHAFRGREHGLVAVRLTREARGVRLEIADDGSGLPADRHWPESGSLGGRIVRSLVTGLDGRLAVSREGGGTRVALEFPLR